MPNAICCVCNTPIEGPVKTLGGRTFCERHYAKLTRHRMGTWGASLALVLGLVVFVVVVFALAPVLRGVLSGTGLVIAGTVLALVPAAVWLVVFYLQDRVEPEPKGYLIELAILGALLASAVGQPLITNVFRVNQWASGNLWLKLFAGIFVVGAIQEFLKYAAVRYTIYGSQEFDERTDGIIYGAAAGLGYATLLNIAYVIGNGGVDLGIGAIRVAVTALAQASFAGVTGYFLGRAEVRAPRPALAAGRRGVGSGVERHRDGRAGRDLAFGTAGHAVERPGPGRRHRGGHVRRAVRDRAAQYPGRPGIGVMRSAAMTTGAAIAPRRSVRAQEPEWVVWVTVLVMLAIGLIVRGVVTGRHRVSSRRAPFPSSIRPAGSAWPTISRSRWRTSASRSMPASSRPACASGRCRSRRSAPWPQTPGDLALKWSDRQAQDLLGFRVLNMEPVSAGGQAAVKVTVRLRG